MHGVCESCPRRASKPKNNATRRLFDPDNGFPHRPCTAVITQRGRCLPSNVFTALKDTGIEPNSLGCLQRKSSGEIILTFPNTYQKAIFLTKCAITINQQPVAIQDVDHPLTFLNIYDAPHELPDTAIIERLSPYCKVLHHRRGKFREPEGVFNGIRHYRVHILRPIPSYLRFGKTLIVRETDTEYPGYLFAHAQCLFVALTTSSFRQCFRVHELCSSNKVCLAPILD